MSHVRLENICVDYKGFRAVDKLSFSIPKGEVFGFIGPNGAGKTSTIKVLATILKPTSGDAFIGGTHVINSPYTVRKRIGYMPDSFGVYETLSVNQYLHFFAAAYRIDLTKRQTVVDDVLELTELTGKREDLVDGLSRGMKQRLGLARILLHDPDVLLLDEPASGLDPRARIEIRELLKELKNLGKTILISSHILSELSELCTRIGIIEQGKLIVEGSLDDIYKQLELRRTVRVRTANKIEDLTENVEKIPGVAAASEEADRLIVELDEDKLPLEELLVAIQKLGARVIDFHAEEMDMETAFMRLTEGKVS